MIVTPFWLTGDAQTVQRCCRQGARLAQGDRVKGDRRREAASETRPRSQVRAPFELLLDDMPHPRTYGHAVLIGEPLYGSDCSPVEPDRNMVRQAFRTTG